MLLLLANFFVFQIWSPFPFMLPSFFGTILPWLRKWLYFFPLCRKNENNRYEVDFPVNYQDSRSYNTHSYRYSKDHDQSRIRRVNSGPPARGSDMSFNDNRQFLDKFSNDINRPSNRKRLPADRDDLHDSYRRAPPLRSNKKRNKKKKKSGFVPQRGMRGPKENYNERLPEKYTSKRDHKFSTNFDQAAHVNRPYRKSVRIFFMLSYQCIEWTGPRIFWKSVQAQPRAGKPS